VALGVIVAGAAYWPSNAGAVDVKAATVQVHGTTGAVDATPAPAVSNASSVSVSLSGMLDYQGNPVSGTVAASLCGNFKADGTALTEAEQAAGTATNAGQAYCDGTEDLITHILPFVNVSGGGTTFSKTLRPGTGADGIGNEQAQCLPGGLTTCKIAVATTANTNPAGQNWAIKIPIFGGPGTGVTTTAAPSTTEAPATTTTSVDGATTTTAVAPSTTTTTAVAPPTTSTPTTSAPPQPSGPKLTVTPSTDLVSGQVLRVVASGLEAYEGQPFAVSECGNATSEGAPLGEALAGNCFGGDGIGSGQLKLLAVSGGRVETDYPVATGPIGANKAICTPAVAEPCRIMVADVGSAGNAVRLEAAISLRGDSVVSAGGADGGGVVGGSDGTATAGPAAAAPTSGTLPYTGPGIKPWILLAVGLALLDLGWLGSGLARAPRHQR
jgi:hypothetical protein